MFSTTSWVIFGIVAIVVVAVVWKFWKKPAITQEVKTEENVPLIEEPIVNQDNLGPPPPMVFAVNDNGNLDLTDMSGKILNISYGPNPKVYINLLDLAEKDTTKIENEAGIHFLSNVGTTKSYQVAGRPYIINYTRL